jgi:hypothetical protein
MALGLNFGDGGVAGDGESLLSAFTKINNMFTTTTKLGNGDLQVNGVNIGYASNLGSTVVGNAALTNITTGSDNTAVGWSALKTNQTGGGNVAIGNSAMFLANGINANRSTAIGNGALYRTTGENNTSIGVNSMYLTEGGNNNTAVGAYAMEKTTSGYYNVALGVAALFANQTGDANTAIGREALSLGTNYNFCTAIGHQAQVDGDYQVQLGGSATTPYIYNAIQSRSDLRDKTEVRDTVLGLDFINELRPVDYKMDMREDYRTEKPILNEDATEEEKLAYEIILAEWLEASKLDNITHDGTHTRTRYHHGLIAQEVQEVIDASGVDFGGFQDHKVNGGGDVLSIGYTELIAPMIKAIQELTARINVLEGN